VTKYKERCGGKKAALPGKVSAQDNTPTKDNTAKTPKKRTHGNISGGDANDVRPVAKRASRDLGVGMVRIKREANNGVGPATRSGCRPRAKPHEKRWGADGYQGRQRGYGHLRWQGKYSYGYRGRQGSDDDGFVVPDHVMEWEDGVGECEGDSLDDEAEWDDSEVKWEDDDCEEWEGDGFEEWECDG
jgi:hypothetical protein